MKTWNDWKLFKTETKLWKKNEKDKIVFASSFSDQITWTTICSKEYFLEEKQDEKTFFFLIGETTRSTQCPENFQSSYRY